MTWLYAMKSSNAIMIPSFPPIVEPTAGMTQCSTDAGYCFACQPLSNSFMTLNNSLFRGYHLLGITGRYPESDYSSFACSCQH